MNTEIDGSQKPEEIRPRCLENVASFGLEPNLVFVAFVVRRAAQDGWCLVKEEPAFFRKLAEDSEVLAEIGRTSLKARNCFAAASELCNKCLERDSLSSKAWFMRGH